MMKFLICGLGSIGQRHVRMIQAATNGNAVIGAYRSRKLDIVITDNLQATMGEDPATHYGLKTFDNLDDALAWQPDAVFVTNPISMHISTALAAANAGCNLFIEKPLGHEMSGVDELHDLVKEKNLTCMVGYQQRYHPGYRYIKELIESGALGRLTSADLHFGEWLPGMHPYEDYRISHAARKDQGGGVILCLSHEIDMAYWLFGAPDKVYAAGGHLSDLETDVEDTAEITLICGNAGRAVPVHLHLDFLQKPPRRYIHVVGEAGSVLFDYAKNRLEFQKLPDGKSEVISYDSFKRNDMFLGEVTDFINSMKQRTEPPVSLGDGIAVLDICLAAKKSLENGATESLL